MRPDGRIPAICHPTTSLGLRALLANAIAVAIAGPKRWWGHPADCIFFRHDHPLIGRAVLFHPLPNVFRLSPMIRATIGFVDPSSETDQARFKSLGLSNP